MAGFGQTRAVCMMTFVLGAFNLSSCAVSTPATLTSAQNAARGYTSVELLSEEGVTGLRARFLDELSGSFVDRGVTVQEGADFVADFSVSERAASVGLQEISEDTGTVETIEPTFRSRWYDKCKPSRVSASLVIYSRSSGAVQTKSTGEFLACPGDLSQLGNLSELLVERVVAN